MRRQKERGFTLIELLTVVVIVAILSLLGLTSFYTYRANSAYGAVEQTLRNAQVAAEAGVNDLDNPPGSVELTRVEGPGEINGPLGEYLRGMSVGRNMVLQASYASGCLDGGCDSEFVQINHCFGHEYASWTRFGDGSTMILRNLAGEGCP